MEPERPNSTWATQRLETGRNGSHEKKLGEAEGPRDGEAERGRKPQTGAMGDKELMGSLPERLPEAAEKCGRTVNLGRWETSEQKETEEEGGSNGGTKHSLTLKVILPA